MSFNINKLVQPECGAPNPLVAAAQQIVTRSAVPHYNQKSRLPNARSAGQSSASAINFAKEFVQREPPPLPLGMSSSRQVAPSSRPSGSVQLVKQQHQQQQQQQYSQHHLQPQPPMMINRVVTGPAAALSGFQQQQSQTNAAGLMMTADQRFHHQDHLGLMNSCGGGALSASFRPVGAPSSISAGDQLETKYRNDMISQSASVDLARQTAESAASATASSSSSGKLDDVEFWQSLSQTYMGPSTFNTIAKLRAERAAAAAGQAKATTPEATTTNDNETSELTDDATAANGVESIDVDGDQAAELDKLIESMKLADLEYTFDERNPLKDKFEDPFEEGLRRLQQGDIPSAALLFEASVQREPENALAWRYLGTTQAQNEMDKSAIKALSNCLRLEPSDQQARLAIAVSLVNESRRREACRHLLEWLIRHDRYKGIEVSLDQLQLFDQQSSDEIFPTEHYLLDKHYCYVRDKFVEAARMSPNNPDPDVQNSLGVLFNMRGEYDKAVDCFKAALSVRQDDSLLWNRLGATLANGNKSEEAVIAYRRALEISPGFLRSRYNLAISLIHFNLYDEAAKQLIQILNTQAAGQGSSETAVRSRAITSSSIWNTLRTVATLMGATELYSLIDGRQLAQCNEMIMSPSWSSRSQGWPSASSAAAGGTGGGAASAAASS